MKYFRRFENVDRMQYFSQAFRVCGKVIKTKIGTIKNVRSQEQ